MTDRNARANAAAEVKRGDESLAAAQHLLTGDFFNDAISRAYYAAFHWAAAVLLTKGLEAKTHRGTIQLFSLHFVKDGPLDQATAGELAHLETYRELGDYASTAIFTRAQASAEIERATRFIANSRPLVEAFLSTSP